MVNIFYGISNWILDINIIYSTLLKVLNKSPFCKQGTQRVYLVFSILAVSQLGVCHNME